MIYYGVLAVLTCMAVLNRAAMPFAMTLALGLLGALIIEPNYMVLPWIDTLMIYPLVWFASRAPKWWTLAVVGLSACAVLCHLVYWSFYFAGIWLGPAYQVALNAAFLAQMGLLVYGGYDVGNRLSRLREHISVLRFGGPRLWLARVFHPSRRQKEGA